MSKYIIPERLLPIDTQGGNTGNDWCCVRVETTDGKVYKNTVVYYGNEIIAVLGYSDLPFDVNDIKKIVATHREDYPADFSGFKTFKGSSASSKTEVD